MKSLAQRDALDREILSVMANGMSVSHTYDGAVRETALGSYGPTGAALALYTASCDAVSSRLSVQESDGSRVSYAYDATYWNSVGSLRQTGKRDPKKGPRYLHQSPIVC